LTQQVIFARQVIEKNHFLISRITACFAHDFCTSTFSFIGTGLHCRSDSSCNAGPAGCSGLCTELTSRSEYFGNPHGFCGRLALPTLEQDDFWLNQPKNINLFAFKVLEHLYEFT
jgi:hypothetical protein